MIKQLTTFLFFFSAALIVSAQVPRNIQINGPLGHPDDSRGLCNEAGSYTFGTLVGQSNDVDPDTIFLCFNDILPILHNGDFDLSGDPDASTPAGIGYALYDCMPSVSGPDLPTIITDPCVNHTSPILVGGFPVPQLNGIWVSTGNIGGDIDLVNDGTVQMAFNNGALVPTYFWIAPITIDNFANLQYENTPSGPCVDVSTDQAVFVVYLTEITASNITTNASPTGCLGSFLVEGGLPELNPLKSYNIDISLQGDPTIKGTFTSVPNHGDVVEFNVPQAGIYDVTIEDGKSCGTSFTMDMGGCQSVIFNMPFENVPPGGNVCLPLSVENFVNIASVQFTITWDPSILTFDTIPPAGVNPAFPNLSQDFNFFNPQPGVLTFSWNTFTNGVSLADGEVFFEMCFDVIGNLGDCSAVSIVGNPVPIEVGDPSLPEPFQYGVILNNGKVIVSNEVIFLLMEQDSVSCAGNMDGAFSLTLGGGTAPYQYSWNSVPPVGPDNGPFVVANAGGSQTQGGLSAGLYQVTVTDSSVPQEVRVDTIEVFGNPSLGLSLDASSPLCNGESTGELIAQVLLDGSLLSNPGDDYVFVWNIAGQTNDTLSNVPSGFYAVTVTDGNNCTAMASATLAQPTVVNVLQNSTFITDASCSGIMDGEITLAAQGGVASGGNYTFTWDTGLSVTATSSTLNNLEPGSYSVTITDDNDCAFQTSFNVGAQKTLSIVDVISDISCNSLCDGEIFITGSTSGAPADLPYSFSWSSFATPPVNNATTSQLTDLCPGTYMVTLTDASVAGCQTTGEFIVAEPQPLLPTLLEQVNETCIVGNDGSATIGITGGTFPYTYAWSHDGTVVDSIATGLSEGSYTFDVTDANNCTASLQVNILAPTPPNIIQLNDDFVSCAGDTDGELTVVALPGGAAIAAYSWSGGLMGATISNLSPGQYIVTVTGEDFCEAIDTAFVNSPPALVLDSITTQMPQCPGDGDGQIAVFASGGTEPYSYTWSTNPGVPTIFNPLPGLFAGNYTVTVTDANDCPALVLNANVVDPASIEVAITDITGVSCPDDLTCDGLATASAMYSDGTTGIFAFTWSSGEQDLNTAVSDATMLCRGAQTVDVSDGECGVTAMVDVPTPASIQVAVTQNQPSCFSYTDGSVVLAPTGGTGNFTYQWVGFPETSETLSDIPAGTYTAILTDANNCTHQQIVQLAQPFELMLEVDPTQSTPFVSCNGDADGIIAVVYNSSDPINPIGPNAFTWSGNVAPSSSSIAANLEAGTYTVTITDIEGCTDEVSYTINQPDPIFFAIEDPMEPLCYGEQTQIFIDTAYGGAGAAFSEFQFIIDNNGLSFPVNQGAPVFAGPHTVTIVDPMGCTNVTDVTIGQPAELEVSLPAQLVIELGDTLNQLTPIITGGTQPYASFQWTPADFLSSDTVLSPFIIPLGNQEYQFMVIDANDCLTEASIFVELDANRNVYIPNIFSPNGDGPNDEFRIFACRGVESINFARIFNRWGGLVYESDDIPVVCEGGTILWDGRFHGDLAPSAVYVYVVEVTFLDGVTLTYRGDIAIIR
ncbi:MAG: gliding motility-associated C-terminal domain-containing protein [Saprospiraceae bacterium]|nr:gliding motility-associated C-terminal domain-containing protein [Saprospiraceae bacterium]MCB9324570.1 gliding motility-associated C-terminal domain-containing protein [Lewinellaceae bacterium]